MVLRAIGTIMTATVLSASVAWAGGLSEELESNRMTVVKVDKSAGTVLLRKGISTSWLQAPDATIVGPYATRRDLGLLNAGDIVRVHQHAGEPTIIILRSAADEIGRVE
jgi:hypothetical protein